MEQVALGPPTSASARPAVVQPATQWDQRVAAAGVGRSGPTSASAADQEAATEPKWVMQRAHHHCVVVCHWSLVGEVQV